MAKPIEKSELPKVIENINEIIEIKSFYHRWQAFGKPMTFQDLLHTSTKTLDALLMLEWVDQKIDDKTRQKNE